MYLNKRTSIFIQTFILIVLLILYIFSFYKEQSKSYSITILTIVLLSVVTYLLRKESVLALKNQYIRITSIFIISYIIVYFQLHIDYSLDFIKSSNIRFWVNPKIVPRALVLSAIGLVSFFLGYELTNDKGNEEQNHQYFYSTQLLKILSFLLLLITIISINKQYLYGGYGKYEMGNIARYSSILFELSVSAIFIEKIISLHLQKKTNIGLLYYISSIGIFQWILIGLYMIMVLISGDRGSIIYISMSFISSFVVLTHWKISAIKIIVLIFLASFLMSILTAVRNKDTNLTVSEKIYKAIVKGHKPYKQLEGTKSISNTTVELASSLRCLHNALNTVPEKEYYFMGQFQFLKLITIFPLGQKIVQNIFGIDEDKLTSERYITSLIGGKNGSEGTCCVGDLYLDYGLAGVLFGLLFFGYFIRIIELNAFSEKLPSLIILCAFIVFCQYSIYIPRSGLLVNLRNVVWLFLIILFTRLLSFRKPNTNIKNN